MSGRFDLSSLPIETSFIHLPLERWADINANMTLTRGGWGSGTKKLASTAATNNTTITHVLEQSVLLPQKLSVVGDIVAARGEVAAQADLELVVMIRRTGGPPATSLQLDAQVYVSDTQGGAGSNLVTTSPIDLLGDTIDTWTEHRFTIDGSGGLAEAKELSVHLRTVNNDTGGTGGGTIEIGHTRLDVPKRGGG